MPTGAKKQKGANGSKEASGALRDLFVIECSRKTEMDQYDDACYVDNDNPDQTEEDIKLSAQKDDGNWYYHDIDGKIVVFNSLAKANLFAAKVWDQMHISYCYGHPVSPSTSEDESESSEDDCGSREAGDNNDSKAGKKHYSETGDGMACYQQVKDYYFDYDGDDLENTIVITTKVEVKQATLQP